MFSLIPWKRKMKDDGGRPRANRERLPLARFRDEVDALFDRFFREWPGVGPGHPRKDWPLSPVAAWPPAWGFDVEDRENEIVVRAEAPGFDPEDFDVEVSGNRLLIRAEHKEQSKGENGFRYTCGALDRVFPLPDGIEAEKVDARYRRGVLQVSVPKGERARGRRITVSAR